MTNPCSIDGCDRWAETRGLCQRHYHAAWRAKTIPIKRNKSRLSPPIPAEPPRMTAEQIDALTPYELNEWVMEKIYGQMYGCLRARHPDAEAFALAHNLTRPRRGGWLWPNRRPRYESYLWHMDRPAENMQDAWFLLETMLSHPKAAAFEAMLLEGKFHRLPYTPRFDGPKDAALFITRCALKAALDAYEASRPQP